MTRNSSSWRRYLSWNDNKLTLPTRYGISGSGNVSSVVHCLSTVVLCSVFLWLRNSSNYECEKSHTDLRGTVLTQRENRSREAYRHYASTDRVMVPNSLTLVTTETYYVVLETVVHVLCTDTVRGTTHWTNLTKKHRTAEKHGPYQVREIPIYVVFLKCPVPFPSQVKERMFGCVSPTGRRVPWRGWTGIAATANTQWIE